MAENYVLGDLNEMTSRWSYCKDVIVRATVPQIQSMEQSKEIKSFHIIDLREPCNWNIYLKSLHSSLLEIIYYTHEHSYNTWSIF